MPEIIDIVEAKHYARNCAVKRSQWVYVRRYADPVVRRYIATRAPTSAELAHTYLFAGDYVAEASVGLPTACRHLKELAKVGFVEERLTLGGRPAWYIVDPAEGAAIGRRIIKQLRREGLVFDDYKI